jgi:hypothetical protein
MAWVEIDWSAVARFRARLGGSGREGWLKWWRAFDPSTFFAAGYSAARFGVNSSGNPL